MSRTRVERPTPPSTSTAKANALGIVAWNPCQCRKQRKSTRESCTSRVAYIGTRYSHEKSLAYLEKEKEEATLDKDNAGIENGGRTRCPIFVQRMWRKGRHLCQGWAYRRGIPPRRRTQESRTWVLSSDTPMAGGPISRWRRGEAVGRKGGARGDRSKRKKSFIISRKKSDR
jgi:hypothetical protein